MRWSVTVQSILHLRISAVLLEDVLLLELVLLLRHNAGQFEEQPTNLTSLVLMLSPAETELTIDF